MARFVSIYRYTPEQAEGFAKKLFALQSKKAPKEILDALDKFKEVSVEYSVMNNVMFYIYEIDDKDLNSLNLAALWFADVCTMETYPVYSAEEHAKAALVFAKIRPDLLEL
jgi:hypothetical protein